MPILEDEFGDIVRKARVGLGIDPVRLAKDVGMAPDHLAALEGYERKPSREESDALAGRLRLHPEALWGVAAEQYVPRRMRAPEGLEILSFIFPGMDSKGYAVRWRDPDATLFFDPGGNPDEIVEALDERGWSLDAILLTHGHSDHVAGLDGVRRRFPVPVYAPAEEWSGEGLVGVTGEPHVTIEGVTIQVIPCPGHTPHGVTFVASGIAVVGDTLFAGSLGGPYRGTAYYDRLLASAGQIIALSDETVLLPGHGPATTVGEEKRHNPFLAR